jgi:hypothetical protein
MIRKLFVAAVATAALVLPALAHAALPTPPKPAWCHGGAGALCNAANNSLTLQLDNGTRPYEDAWESGSYGTGGIRSSDDPDCYAYSTTGSVQCWAFYSYRNRYYFIDAAVNASQAAHETAHIYGVQSYRRRWVTCTLGKDAFGKPVPGRLTSNNDCGDGEGQSEPYFVDVEMDGAEGKVRYAREVGWQFTDSGYISSSFFRAVGSYRCVNGSTITCRDGAGDEFKYIR